MSPEEAFFQFFCEARDRARDAEEHASLNAVEAPASEPVGDASKTAVESSAASGTGRGRRRRSLVVFIR